MFKQYKIIFKVIRYIVINLIDFPVRIRIISGLSAIATYWALWNPEMLKIFHYFNA